MARTNKTIGYRVVVGTRYAGDFGYAIISREHRTLAEEEKICDGIARAIKAHVGKFDHDRGNVEVESIEKAVCSHCGSEWDAMPGARSNGCCDKDADEEESLSIPDLIKYVAEAEAEAERRRDLFARAKANPAVSAVEV